MARKFKYILSSLFILSVFTTLFTSCTPAESLEQKPVEEAYLSAAREIMNDVIVLNATAMQGRVNKTLLEQGCPLKYYLTWKSDDVMNLQIREFSVGTMPIKIWFSIDCQFMMLNTWEKKEYGEKDWVKFQGKGGSTVMEAIDENYDDGNGGAGTVQGYLNIRTHQVEFVTNFNVMNFSADVYPQTINPARLEHFEEEFAQYEKDLAEYKKANGIS